MISDKQMALVKALEIDITIMMMAVDKKTEKQMLTMVEMAADAFDGTPAGASFYINTMKAAQRVARHSVNPTPKFRKAA